MKRYSLNKTKDLPRSKQKGFITASQIPYLLLALALLLALLLWNSIRSKNDQLAELEQQRSSEVAALESKIQTNSKAMEDLQGTHQALLNEHTTLTTESIPSLKKDLSFASAEMQRAKHVKSARNNLQAALASANDSNSQLKQQLDVLPGLKRDLSFASAEAQRSKHVKTARDNLQAALASAKDSNSQLTQQLHVLPELKRELSFARADAQRAQHISDARDNLQTSRMNLMTELQAAKEEKVQLAMQLQKSGKAGSVSAVNLANLSVDELAALNTTSTEIEDLQLQNKYLIERLIDRLLTISRLKKDLSFANAENQRGLHVVETKNRLMGQLQQAKQDQEHLAEVATQLPDLKRQLSMAKADNARLQHVRKARDRLIALSKQSSQLVQK